MRTAKEEIEFQESRREIVGGSDIATILGVSKWGCQLRTYNQKKNKAPDFVPAKVKAEFRRGHRLEEVAAQYYCAETGRQTDLVELMGVPGKPHLSVHMDRLVTAAERSTRGYLEIKVVGRETFFKIQKEGLPDDYISQVHYGCHVSKLTWGAVAVYWPDGDALMHWDFEADHELGALAAEKADDWWMFHVEADFPPEPLPSGSKQCKDCEYRISCPASSQVAEAETTGVVDRPDLADLARELKEARAYKSEYAGSEGDLKEAILGELKKKPGLYRWAKGEPLLAYTESTSERFDAKAFKSAHPDLHAKFTKPSVTKKLAFTGDKDE